MPGSVHTTGTWVAPKPGAVTSSRETGAGVTFKPCAVVQCLRERGRVRALSPLRRREETDNIRRGWKVVLWRGQWGDR